jgi:hypothetical protein
VLVFLRVLGSDAFRTVLALEGAFEFGEVVKPICILIPRCERRVLLGFDHNQPR